jgi:hypothetical protein
MILLMKKIGIITLILLALYGLGRVYYRVTDGFMIQNIEYTKAADPRYSVVVPPEHLASVKEILSTPFYYLGKGCQSYVFEDKSKTYVIKFLKYQRYRPTNFLYNFDFIPWVSSYCEARTARKLEKVHNVYQSWKTALVMAPEETGVLFIHLNKEHIFDRTLTVYDKMGLEHQIDLNSVEFLLQKKAQMIQPYLENLIRTGQTAKAEAFLKGMLDRIVSGFQRGISDNDYALLQNTGVSDDKAVYIDVGQIIYNPAVKDPSVYKRELFNKTYKFSVWLNGASPELGRKFKGMLVDIIGVEYDSLPPYESKSDMGDLPNLFQ